MTAATATSFSSAKVRDMMERKEECIKRIERGDEQFPVVDRSRTFGNALAFVSHIFHPFFNEIKALCVD